MPAAAFEKNNFDWQIQQLWQRAGEWLELKFPRNLPNVANVPEWSLPSWLLQVAFWTIVLLAAIWLGWLLWQVSSYLYLGKSEALRRRSGRSQIHGHDRTVADWIHQMQEFQRNGNYREACRTLYMATLQRLNDTKLVPHQASRTDGEYLQIIQQLPQAQSYQTLIRTHEQLCFGTETISAEKFEHCQQAYQEIEQGSSRSRETL